jgi:hypothetical protein
LISFPVRTRIKVWTQLNRIEYYTYETAENKAHKVLLRGLPPEVTAEMILSELKHVEYPVIHVR